MILLLKPTKQTSFDICFCFAVFLQIMETNKRHFLLFCVFCLRYHKNGSFMLQLPEFAIRTSMYFVYNMLNNIKKYLVYSCFYGIFVKNKNK